MAAVDRLEIPELPLHQIESDVDELSLMKRTQDIAWQTARRMVQPFVHDTLTQAPLDYRPIRHAVLNPDIEYAIETSSGEYPVFIFNRDALGDRSDQGDIVMHMSLAVRADQGFVSPTASHLEGIAREQERALIMIGAPGSNGTSVSLSNLARLHLPGIVRSSHKVLDGVAEQEKTYLTHATHFGASLGGYITLSFADPEITEYRDVHGMPEHIVDAAIPVAPAGWKLRPHQRVATAYQFMVLEPAHVIDKAAQMPPDEREEYLLSFRETIPHISAYGGIGKLALEFMCSGNLSQVVERLPRDLKIRAVAFDGDHVTIPFHLLKSLSRRDFQDAEAFIMDGRHMSLASFRKVMAKVVEPTLLVDYKAS